MYQAQNIQTGEIIAKGDNRAALYAQAARIVGAEGFCIRETNPAPTKVPARWATTDGEWWM